MEKIILEVKPDGSVKYEYQGQRGNACTKRTDWLDRLLGRVKSRTFKKEFHEHEYVKTTT